LKVALAYFNQAIDEDPNYAQAYSGLADTYAVLGDWQHAVMSTKEALPKAKAAAIKGLELDSTLSDPKKSSNASFTNAPQIAMIYASMGDNDQAMHWLERAYEERFNPSILLRLLRSGFDPLRSDPRFEDLMRRIGLAR